MGAQLGGCVNILCKYILQDQKRFHSGLLSSETLVSLAVAQLALYFKVISTCMMELLVSMNLHEITNAVNIVQFVIVGVTTCFCLFQKDLKSILPPFPH